MWVNLSPATRRNHQDYRHLRPASTTLSIAERVRREEEVPEDLQNLDEQLSDTYFCNFSLFQSIPDSWAIKQLFPVMPIHRLDERPTRESVLGDVTCDSDGKIDQFIDRRDVKRTLPLHAYRNEPYYLGAFLFRRAISRVLDRWIAEDFCSATDADEIVTLIAHGNSRRIYPM